MIKISDALNEDELSRLAARTVKVGDVYEITMTEANGIKPKPGDASRDKYFVVLGFDSEGVAYGGVIINSQINKNLHSFLWGTRLWKKYLDHLPMASHSESSR
jgi:hypothetical protein